MKKSLLRRVALGFAMPIGAAAAASAPSFEPLANPQASSSLQASPILKPEAHIMRAPRVSEMRMVPGPDGELRVVCSEIPNPRLRDSDGVTGGGPRR